LFDIFREIVSIDRSY